MSVIIPLLTDVSINLPASVEFIAPSGIFDFACVVGFVHPQNEIPINLSVTCQTSSSGSGGNSGNGTDEETIPLTIQGGSAVGISPSVSDNMINYTVPRNGAWLTGIQCSGETNAAYVLTQNGNILFRLDTNISNPNIDYQLDGVVAFNPNDVIVLQVTNTGESTADFYGSLMFASSAPSTPPAYLQVASNTNDNVTVASTETLGTFTVSLSGGGSLASIQAAGDTDGIYQVTVNGNQILSFITNILNVNVTFNMPGLYTLYYEDVVAINVTNIGENNASYTGTLLGVF